MLQEISDVLIEFAKLTGVFFFPCPVSHLLITIVIHIIFTIIRALVVAEVYYVHV